LEALLGLGLNANSICDHRQEPLQTKQHFEKIEHFSLGFGSTFKKLKAFSNYY